MLHDLLNPTHILALFGYIGLAAIVFAESGLLLGFFLPGDSLLITAGIFASQGHLNIIATITAIVAAAIIGDSTGYLVGAKIGSKLFQRKDSRWFSQQNVKEADSFFEKYGAQSIIFARFVPVVRTFVPTIAGTAQFSYKKFIVYNVLGGTLWGLAVTLLGYTLGRVIPNMDRYILPVIIMVIAISFVPAVLHVQKYRLTKAKETPND